MEVSVEAFDAPDTATGFEVNRRPAAFSVEGRATDIDDGADRAVWLLL